MQGEHPVDNGAFGPHIHWIAEPAFPLGAPRGIGIDERYLTFPGNIIHLEASGGQMYLGSKLLLTILITKVGFARAGLFRNWCKMVLNPHSPSQPIIEPFD